VPDPVLSPEDVLCVREVVDEVYIDERIKGYIVDIVLATRDPKGHKLADLVDFIEYGASPRASIALAKTSKAHAFLRHRGYVTPEDIKAIGPDVLRHRVILTYEAEAEEITAERIVQRVLETVPVP
jgi:MoxR-like ATPase